MAVDRRTILSGVALALSVAWLGTVVTVDPVDLPVLDGVLAVLGAVVRAVGVLLAIAVGVAVVIGLVVLIAHQYVRWRAYRPAIHVAVAVLVFVAGLAVWLGPAGVGSAREPPSASQRSVIRIAGVTFLFGLFLLAARYFDRPPDGDEGE